MKKLLPLLLLIVIGCEKYEFVDKNTRFNKWTGETEILTGEGEWIEKSKQLKEKSEKETQNFFDILTNVETPFPKSEQMNVKGIDGTFGTYLKSPYRDGNFSVIIENNSNWRIEEIDIKVDIYSKSDSLFLITRKFTGYNNSSDDGIPFTTTYYHGRIPQLENNQYFKWSISECRGIKYKE